MTDIKNNPLLGIGFEIPFHRIRAEHVEPAIRHLLEVTESKLEAVASVSVPRTYENTMTAVDRLTDELDLALTVVRHLESVATTPEFRAAYNVVEPLASAFYARIPLHDGLWRALNEFAATPEAASLQGVKKRFLEKTIAAFRRQGAALPPPGKAELEKMDVELSALTTKFSENVLDSTNAFELILEREEQLSGLPESAIEVARESAAAKGMNGWRFTLQQPSYLPLMTYMDDRTLRERVYRAYQTRASAPPYQNKEILSQILELRGAKARLLSFADFADFILEDRMAARGARAQQFLDDLHAKTEPFFRVENDDLTAYRKQLEGENAPPLQPWDVAYYAEKLRKTRFDLDEEMLRPYFPMERVLEGMFEIVHRLYGIQIAEKPGVEGWDPQVKFYRIHDSDGSFLGAFYADWFPRENKRGGAWMDAFLTGSPTPFGLGPHLGLMCGNMNPPSGGKPALLTHRDVETVFHEFGHLLHHCLTRVEVRSLAGTSVAWDFVELPSQIMENWCWEREALDLFARHWETGAPLPEDLFARMQRARTFRAANAMMRQISFGCVDLALHRQYKAERDGDVIAYSRRLLAAFSAAPLPADHAMMNGFTHLFANPVGYAAAYYSYKWAEVLDADAFSVFKREGVFSRKAGMRFRTEILAKGDSEEPAGMFRGFLGRDPDPSALFERAGLVA
ncbi:MAG: M3 family metallopeptidase [Acidobacteriia bacterium]|nr:M3 family metallopeptidase [Terriglobia bacterium]